MRAKNKSIYLKNIINKLNSIGIENPVWKSVAKGLSRPRSKRYEVNLYKLEKFARKNEAIIVPGSVLGSGEITKPITIAALKFSETAEKKIKKAGGICMSIEEFAEKNISASKVRIMG